MKISEPVFIRKTAKRGYAITGSLSGYGTIRRYGQSEEEAKERFFEACNRAGNGPAAPKWRPARLSLAPRSAC